MSFSDFNMSDWKQSLLVIIVSFIIISTPLSYHVEAKAPKVLKMSFPNFSHRKKPFNEKCIKTKKNSCEMHPDCQNKHQGTQFFYPGLSKEKFCDLNLSFISDLKFEKYLNCKCLILEKNDLSLAMRLRPSLNQGIWILKSDLLKWKNCCRFELTAAQCWFWVFWLFIPNLYNSNSQKNEEYNL